MSTITDSGLATAAGYIRDGLKAVADAIQVLAERLGKSTVGRG